MGGALRLRRLCSIVLAALIALALGLVALFGALAWLLDLSDD